MTPPTKIPTVDTTIAFIKHAHAGQVDKSGLAYWHHPVGVMTRLGPDAPLDVKLTALLHDVIEDTPYTAESLLAKGYPVAVVDAVKIVSRPKDYPGRPTYHQWIKSIADSGNIVAIKVKIADKDRLNEPIIAIGTDIPGTVKCFVDGNHRAVARWELGITTQIAWIVPADRERGFRMAT